ncbi:ATP-binding cassette domain-containing protein [Fictibacillus nanhaiensis]|uniref:ABC transporter ATP-binding protein n=1 Tax=Fictibacillus nanhaiensis TaxID=742169 RepID=UPI001C944DBD|nr:ATP-binding cassette domain-containing protein [Fictibacillus nanhaiensis]MBY6035830.1 ATP-binding cassette domain-containing protein [Fictibacillus nanhaiensis]
MDNVSFVDHLRLKFPHEKSLLFKDLSLSFHKGEKVLLLGPSGCGKSTLLQVLSGLIPKAIEVPIKHEKIQIPEAWGFVFQDPDSQFCMPYVDEEIAFVLENLQVQRDEMIEKIQELLNTVGLQIDNIHTPIQSLSGGMKQRLAIASVLALNPEVLFLDEPTALLDEQGTAQIWDTIKNISEHKTVIIVEHKVDQILDFIDRVIVFTPDGKILADGDVSYVFSNYQEELDHYGIWYPGVWDSYLMRNKLNKHYKKDGNKHSLRLKNFKGFRNKEVMIAVEDAEIYPGEWISVIGKNGSGKSTLLLSLMQLLRTTGTYTIHNQCIHKIEDLQDKAYFVFQNPEYQFITNTVYDEITYAHQIKKADQQAIRNNADEILSIFGLKDKIKHHPYQLSHGQKRRLSVATAFVQSPKLLLLDEPTFGQDSKNTFKLLEMLENQRKTGTIIIMVTHDQQVIKHFGTRVWEVQGGKVIKDWKNNQRSKEDKNAYSFSQ